jgi:hypothetical protein
MNAKRITQAIILGTVVAWIGWDIYAASNGVDGDTESEVIRLFANRHPFLPLAMGVLMSHFFWNVRASSFRLPRIATFVGLPVVGIAGAVLDFAGLLPWVHPLAPFVIGIFLGRLLWPQRIKT